MVKARILVIIICLADLVLMIKDKKTFTNTGVKITGPEVNLNFKQIYSKETIVFKNFHLVPLGNWTKRIDAVYELEGGDYQLENSFEINSSLDSVKFSTILSFTLVFFVFLLTIRHYYLDKRMRLSYDCVAAERARDSLIMQSKRKYSGLEVIYPIAFFAAIFLVPWIHGTAWFWLSFAFWLVILMLTLYVHRNVLIRSSIKNLYNHFVD